MHASRYSRTTASVAMLLLAACAETPTAPTAPAHLTRITGSTNVLGGLVLPRAIVVFKDTASVPTLGLTQIALLGGVVHRSYPQIGVVSVNGLTAAALAQLAANPMVSLVGFDRALNWLPRVRGLAAIEATAVSPSGNPWEAAYFADGRQWGPRIMQADVAWHAGLNGSPNVKVAIIDTGIDYTNRELAGLVDMTLSRGFSELIVEAEGQVVFAPDPQLPGDQPFMDNHFHGTHVASTVASNAISVTGIANRTTLVAVKVLSAIGSASFETVAAGITHAAGDANVDIINMSLGANVDVNEEGVAALLEFMTRTIRWAEKQGTIVISAAGNDALNLDIGSLVSTPCEQSTICVSATGPLLQQDFDQPSTYTNYGITAIEVAAPGGNATDSDSTSQTEDLIIGACSTRTSEPGLAPCRASTQGVAYFYAWAAGTSMATPHVAGLAALVKSVNPMLSVKGLKNRILNSADDVGTPGRDVYSNYGRVNARRAVGL